MIIATWNTDSIRARETRLLDWLRSRQPYVLCIQELKATERDFPFGTLRKSGYYAAVFGQKTYNGVADRHASAVERRRLRCSCQ